MEFVNEQLLNDEIGRHIQAIKTPAIKEFVVRSLNLFGDTNKLNESNRVVDLLLAMLKKEEILDLVAYVLSGGNKDNPMFAK